MPRTVALVAIAVVAALAACGSPQWPTDPISEPSEVTGRVWFCTPADPTRQRDDGKDSDSAVITEIVTAVPSAGGDNGRFPPGTVLGRATSQPGEVWRPGSVHQLFIAWRQRDVTRSDLMASALRVRISRKQVGTRILQSPDRWVFRFFVSLDVVTTNDQGQPEIDWHESFMSNGDSVADQDEQTILDTPFSQLIGWPRPCPRG